MRRSPVVDLLLTLFAFYALTVMLACYLGIALKVAVQWPIYLIRFLL